MPKKKPRAPEALSPRARATRLLARREHSAQELTRKLVARGVPEEDAQAAVSELTAEGWQSDLRYAESMVRHRGAQGYGPMRIRADLRAAGVDTARIDEVLAASEIDWTDVAKRLHARRFGRLPANARERQKQYGHLQSRGFDADQIRAVLKGDRYGDN